ncbi:glycosyltransferase family 2 protein [Seonamhaeicola sp. MEBiC1930]|uniref:glycosyltransferase family 2 protein n=1 Tax=Seonamhaeicola sp. MEBiC01930 TaxID=2976768 RepID=UPI00324F1D6F
MSKISIVIPAYNKALSIGETLDSIFKQTFKDYEIIIVDDGSTDGTPSVVQDYEEKVVYLYQENQGQGAARNKGIKMAKGKYLVFLDADDYWEPGFLKTCYDYLENNADVIAVNTAQRTIYANGSSVIHPKDLFRKKPFIIDNFYKIWAQHDHIRTGTAMIRMSTIREVGYQNPNLRVSQDLEYWGLIATYGKWAFIPEPLWVGNSRIHAKKSGWNKKYKIRRKLCPDVEEWEKRILVRILNVELKYFEIVRGRVALGYAHNKLLGGHSADSKHIIKKYGLSFPKGKMTTLLRFGEKYGHFSWAIVKGILFFKERLKDF